MKSKSLFIVLKREGLAFFFSVPHGCVTESSWSLQFA